MANNKTNLQVVITKDLEVRSRQIAKKYGFNSVPEMVRSMLIGITSNKVHLTPFSNLTPEREAIYDQVIKQAKKDYQTGRVGIFTDVDKMITDIEAH